MTDAIQVRGLSEFVRNLGKLDADLPKVIRQGLNEVADVIITDAVPRVPRRSGAAARSIKARSLRDAVRVVGGSKRVPYYPWLDFGGRVGRDRSVVRPFKKDGRYIYDSYYRTKPRIGEQLEVVLLNGARTAGIEVD